MLSTIIVRCQEDGHIVFRLVQMSKMGRGQFFLLVAELGGQLGDHPAPCNGAFLP